MEDLDAPQWADFIAPSPQIHLDDYFFQKNAKTEYRDKPSATDLDSPTISMLKVKQQTGDTPCSNESILIKTPVRKIVSKGSKENIKETTYESIITEAMNNLQLSIKNKSCLMDSPSIKTPSKRVTRSMCAQILNTPKCNLEESFYASPENKNEKSILTNKSSYREIEINIQTTDDLEQESPINEQSSQINLEVTATSTEDETSNEKLESVNFQEMETKQVPKSVIIDSFKAKSNTSGSKKKVSALTGNAWHRQVKRRMSITNHRRMSMSKAPVSKYVSMAEAVTKFQRATPQRFRSVNVKSTRTEQLRRASLKLTRAQSPALMSKTRTRPITVLSREEQEKLEIEEMRQHQVKANPVRKDILNRPAPLKKVEKKMITYPEPFHLTKTKKELLPPPKPKQEVKRVNSLIRKTVPSIDNDETGIIVKDEQVTGYGIPLEPCKSKKKNTKVMPFSFEARNRQLELKKQEKLKKMQADQQKTKAEFHARPVPAAVKTPSNKLSLNSNSTNKPKITIARSLSFESRIKQLQQKKEEKIKQILEEEKKARIFKAQKVPEFKPVLVRGRSKDNLLKRSNENLAKLHNTSDNNKKIENSLKMSNLKNSQENLTLKPKNFIKKPMTLPFVAPKKTTVPITSTENQENRSQGAVPKILEPKCKLSQKCIAVLSELNTDKRAKQRKEFEEQLKKKEIEADKLKKQEEEQRIAREKAQNLELRKIAEVKARPMPVYKPLQIVKSNKLLTDAQSPAWAKKKSTH